MMNGGNMNIGLITINDNNNYGNRLQNYATQEFFRKNYGIDVYTIKNTILLNKNNKNFKYFIKYIVANINLLRERVSISKRQQCFNKFNKKIKYNKFIINWYGNYKKVSDSYDAFLVGSDQVWNPYGRMSDIELLAFTNKRKIAFSPSFAVSEIRKSDKEILKREINKFDAISVRENEGKRILEEITDKDIEILVDPTMLLYSTDWDKIMKKPKQLKSDRFILNYFLGKLSIERKNEIEKIAKENGCEIINILDKKSPFYKTGPSEFLYLEKHAFLICTDSFHSSVFALLYNKPFIVFEREDKVVKMNSRLNTLLSKFKLENRYYKGKITKDLLEANYEEAYNILEEERKKSDIFLRKALIIE